MKRRLDLILFDRKYFDSRSKAQVHVMAGEVYVNGMKERVPSKLIDSNSTIEIKYLSENYVSRGGHKLIAAIEHFNVKTENKICMDIGASTGGFTECLLRNGARKVYSIDVGYGQLDYKLRNDKRVVNIENTNARHINNKTIRDDPDLIVMDVSFVSITKFDGLFDSFSTKNNEFIGLIKPQFELSKNKIGRNGIVKNSSYRKESIDKVVSFLENYYRFVGQTIESPIKGAKGNVEYLVHCKNK